MIKLNKALSCLLLPPALLAAASCSGPNTAKLVNEMSFPLDGVTEIKIAYDEEHISYYQGSGDRLVVLEYMNENNSSYHAKVMRRNGDIHISEGGKPLMGGGFYRYVEVYLPDGYGETLITATTSGDMDFSGLGASLGAFCASTTSGKVEIDTVTADSIKLTTTSGEIACGNLTGEVYLETKSGAISVQSADTRGGVFQAHTTSGAYQWGRVDAGQVEMKTTSGSVTCAEMSGSVTYTTTSGNLAIGSATGSGSFVASNQGEIAVAFTQVTGDLDLTDRNGSINLVLPADLSFHFQGSVRNGSIHTTFGSQLQMEGNILTGSVGEAPTVTVRVETREGDVTVTQ